MMTGAEVRDFLEGRAVYAFDPESRAPVAVVDYRRDGTCLLRFAGGAQESGVYGFEGDAYWTRYTNFRGGETNAFHLERLGPGLAQAYFTDGRKAYLQSHIDELAP